LRGEIEEVEGGIERDELDSEQLRRIQKLNKDFENPLADFFNLA